MPATAAPPQHRCSILIVDDDVDTRELLRLALTADGYAVTAVSNGRDALDHLRSHEQTCAILLDLMLPVMNGGQFRAAQLHDRSLAWIPVVVMSGTVEASEQARELAAHSVLHKPLDLDEVRRTLRNIGCCQARPRRSA